MKVYLLVPNANNKYMLLEGDQIHAAEVLHTMQVILDDIDVRTIAGCMHILHTLYTHQTQKENVAYGNKAVIE